MSTKEGKDAHGWKGVLHNDENSPGYYTNNNGTN
jgi:hypothetical protein